MFPSNQRARVCHRSQSLRPRRARLGGGGVPSESAEYLEGKVEGYLANGRRGVWVLYPEQRVIRLHGRSGSSRLLRETDWVEDPDLLPGFRAPVKKFFEGLTAKTRAK
ncbi:MAG TPA: hypothetical protein VEV85_19970 [Bryobacteraceae bacterium]|nr:hypothetical protein [Bryobacteraceae bacterium]